MPQPVHIRLYDGQQMVFSGEFEGQVELGRERQGEEGPFSQRVEAGRVRVVIARPDEQNVSRRHALFESIPHGGIRLTNLSSTLPIRFPDGPELPPNGICDRPLPLVLTLGDKIVRVQEGDTGEAGLRGLAERTLAPGQMAAGSSRIAGAGSPDALDGKSLVRWLQSAMDVLQSATSSADFFEKAARAAVELLSLDSCRVLLLDGENWQTKAVHLSPRLAQAPEWKPSQRILKRVLREKRTTWEVPRSATSVAASLTGVQAVVAAPILDPRDAILGVLYGERRQEGGQTATGPITELEAMLVELLARGVATGLARLEQERAALAVRVQFEQFFTPALASQLSVQPGLLASRDADVSILFCDIRGFSRISERLGCGPTVEWIGDVMGVLSDCVLAHSGVIVDYIGDELMAMWGAPDDQPDHARLACRAALAMVARLPELNARWRETLGEPMDMGIGINSGVARVGVTGSAYKFKYGPLGPVVNLASRVQGATKHFHGRLLITGSTHAHLEESVASRRLGRVQVVNIAEAVDLYELCTRPHALWHAAKAAYEQALGLYERRQLREAALLIGEWRTRNPDDEPALILLYRAIKAMVEKQFDPVWVLSEK